MSDTQSQTPTTARFVARMVAVWPHLDAWNKSRELADLRRQAWKYNCQASKAVLEALGEPDLIGHLEQVMSGRAPAQRVAA